MKKVIFLSFLAVFCWKLGWAQFGNEWIKFNQAYYKIPTAKDGLYRLTYSDLLDAGFPVGSDPRRIQLFHRGKEQAIYIEGQNDGVFNTTDYLEFYGLKNDGTLDADLYEPSSAQPHPYSSLYNDTTSYFLTYNLTAVGKRMGASNEINVTNIPKESHHFDEKLTVLTDSYSGGYVENDYLEKTAFGVGEGWTGILIRDGQFRDYTFAGLTNGVTAGGLPQLNMVMVGRGPMAHNIEIWVGANASSLRLLTTVNFSGYDAFQVSEAMAWTDIGADGNMVVRVQTIGVGGASDRVSASYIKVRYAQQFNAGGNTGKVFRLQENGSGKSYIEIQNYPASTLLLDITDPENPVRIRTTETTTLNAVVPNTNVERKLLLTNTAITPFVRRVYFRSIDPSQPNFVIISHPLLMKPAMGYSDAVRAYAGYRASPEGGSYDTLVMDINQIYNQFNYGETSPRGIRKFMEYLINSNVPDYLFIIGKGLDVYLDYYRKPSSFTTIKSLVPSAGYPASDMYFTAGLAGTTYEPAVPTGRITAMKPQQVAAYLNKVKEMEAVPYNALWRKNLLHLSGGIESWQPKAFKEYMEDFQAIAEEDYLGGKVKAIAKETTNIEFINISDQVNQGLNLVTFYGHASPGTIDFDIGFVTDPALGYNNQGKYPMFLINGCNAGSFFLNTTLFGEDWINAENKGAVGFIAHSSYGLASTLKRYSEYFYAIGYGDSSFIKKGVGDIQKDVAKTYMETAPPTVAHIAQVQQMILLGDPAVKLFGAPKPDYAIDEKSLSVSSFDGQPVTSMADSFAINVIVNNYGVTTKDTLHIRVTRTFSDNTSTVYDSLFKHVLYSDTLTFVIRKGQGDVAGTNSFKVEIDPNNITPEISESNNTATIDFFIPLNRTRNLYPYDYAIVNDTQVDLRFQTTDLFSGVRDFLVELDTVDTFDSPFKKEFSTSGKVLALQSVNLLTQDSLAYYWRTKLADPLPGESEEWVMSSFSYINDSPEGWAQIHFPQYLKNETEGLIRDPVLRELGFEETTTSIYIHNYGSNTVKNNLDVSIKLNGAEYQLKSTSVTQRIPCRLNTINILAFDKVTTVPYAAIPFLFGDPRTCGREPQIIGSFKVSELEVSGQGIAEYIDNIQAGDSVVLFSIGDAGYTSWSAAVKTKLGELGISVAQINALQAGEPVVIFGKKGSVSGSAIVSRPSLAPANQQELEVNGTVTGRYTFGNMTSVTIGPAQAWQSVVSATETPEPDDEVSIDVVGVTLEGDETVVAEDIDSNISLSSMDANEYPYLKLIYHTQDDLNLTATQLKKWIVLYTPMAEGIVFYNGSTDPVMLTEGETWTGNYGFTNISQKSFPDSLQVILEVFNKTTRTNEQTVKRIKSPAPGDSTLFSLSVNTAEKGGLNDVDVTVNPHITPEQYYDNNRIELAEHLNVQADEFNPVLEVTVDGRQIMDGDYVSPDPEIKLRIWDDNRYTLKNDTTGITVFLQYPCPDNDCPLTPVYFAQDNVTWSPATGTSDFTVSYHPEELAEGIYVLRVQGSDSHGNEAGIDPYEVSFQVNYESAITWLAPFPNPSAGNVTFSLVISGAAAPDVMQMQIFGVDGKMVHEFARDDLFVGRNEIVWNGLDDEGEKVPAGVYIYRLMVKGGGQNAVVQIPQNMSFLKNGYGKLVIVR